MKLLQLIPEAIRRRINPPAIPEAWTPERLRELADALEAYERAKGGDGSAVFLSDMTDEEYEAHTHEHEKGWHGFMEQVRRVTGMKNTDV